MGKPVLSAEQFSYDTVQVGDYVAQEVVDEAMNCLPPACMTSECAQLGEPYSHREDPDTGRWRAVYATFRRVSESVWEYRGHCFRGETTERRRELEAMTILKNKKCPFCGGDVAIHICDDEGNLRSDEYESDPYSGLGFILYHDTNMAKNECPIAHDKGEHLGVYIYESREEAKRAWSKRTQS